MGFFSLHGPKLIVKGRGHDVVPRRVWIVAECSEQTAGGGVKVPGQWIWMNLDMWDLRYGVMYTLAGTSMPDALFWYPPQAFAIFTLRPNRG